MFLSAGVPEYRNQILKPITAFLWKGRSAFPQKFGSG
jgi:hypothetical protein